MVSRTRSRLWCVVVGAALCVVGCGGTGPRGTDAGTEAADASVGVGPQGGTVLGPDGSQVLVPAGALAQVTPIALARSTDGAPPFPPPGVVAAGAVYAATPHGTTFSTPATVTIPFDPALVPSGSTVRLYQAEPGGSFSPIAATVSGTTLVAEVSTFSWFAPGIPSVLVASSVFGHCVREALTGQLWCWGFQGQLADESGLGAAGNTTVFAEPTRLPPRAFGEVAGGVRFTCGISNGAEVWCIGNRTAINLAGVDPPVPQSAWVQIPLPTGVDLYRLSVNANMACGIGAPTSTDQSVVGKVFCFGQNFNDMLGRGPTASPFGVAPIAGNATYAYVAVGGSFVCASQDLANGQLVGTVDCWGSNDRSQLSASTSPASSNVPLSRGVVVATTPGALSANSDTGCGLSNDHTATCWGDNTSGQRGDGTVASGAIGSNFTAPKAISGHTFTSIVAGTTSCGIETGGATLCWGSADDGSLGTGQSSTQAQPTPVSVVAPVPLVELTTGPCGRAQDGKVYCWGTNRAAELGLGQTTPTSSATPVQVKAEGLSRAMP